MNSVRTVFFGSTSDSIIVLSKLYAHSAQLRIEIVALVTQPPRPIGRKQKITPTPVELWGNEHHVPVLSFASDEKKSWLYQNETTVIDTLQPLKADLLISACYGQKIPTATITAAKFGGLNVHPSILPRWRGADPVPWAIYSGDHQTGVTVVTLSEQFDEGRIIAQQKIPLMDTAESDPLRTKLFSLGADLLFATIPEYLASQGHPLQILSGHSKQKSSDKLPYARRLTRDDGFEPWENIQSAMSENCQPDEAKRIERKFRAFSPWPGLWTKINIPINKYTNKQMANGNEEEKRLKILKLSIIPSEKPARPAGGIGTGNSQLSIHEVQLEGKTPVPFSQFTKSYLSDQRN